MDFLLDVLLHDLFWVDQVGLVVLFEHSDVFWLLDSFEGDSLGFDVGGHIGEVEIASPLIEGDGAGVLDHGESVVVDGNSKCNRLVDGGALYLIKNEEEDKKDAELSFHD